MTDELKLRLVDAFNGGRNPAERVAACRAVADSPDVLRFVRRLEADRSRMNAMPRAKAPSSIAANVAKAIKPVIHVRSISPQVTSWRSFVLAASVLVAVGVGTYFVVLAASPKSKQIVRKPTTPIIKNDASGESPSPALVIAAREELPMPGSGAKPSPAVAVRPESMPDRDEEKNWLGARVIPDLPPLESVTPRLPYLILMADWSNEDVRTKLRKELSSAPAHRLDLFARDVPKAVEQFSNAMKGHGVTLTTVPVTAEQLKRKLPASYAIYCESLSVDDWMTVFSKWKPEDSTSAGHLLAAGANESRELKSLLGIDPGLAKRPKEEANRPVGEQTIDQVTRALQKSKSALLTTAGSTSLRVNPAAAPEIRSFMDRRGERPVKAVPMMIVIRAAN